MPDIYAKAIAEMGKAIPSLETNLNTLRTGRANPSLLDNLECDYYGDKILVSQIASFKIPDPRQLMIIPYDKNDVKAIVSAINASQIGITPTVDGINIRLVMPAPTEERRMELAKKAKGYGEATKVAIRNVRRDLLDELKKDDTTSEDFIKRSEEDVQKATNEMITKIDTLVKNKETEIMSI